MSQHKCKYCFNDSKRCSKLERGNTNLYTPTERLLTEADISKLLKRSLRKRMIEEGNICPFVWQPIPQWHPLKYCKVLDLNFLRLNININYILGHVAEFLGCFYTDILPSFPKKFPQSFIMNTEESSKHGKHWVAVVLLEDECLYFDSFGVGVVESELRKYLFSRYKRVSHSRICIQDLESTKCGAFCVDFLLNVKNRADYTNFINGFSSLNLKYNDDILREHFKKSVFLVNGIE